MKPYFLTSLEVEAELCNLRCKYCWFAVGEPHTIRKGNDLFTRKKNETTFDYSVNQLTQNIHKILTSLDSDILKLVGGEILLLPEVVDVALAKEREYKQILIVTNGVNFPIEYLEKLPPQKVSFQVSLDGIQPEANSLRFSPKGQNTQKILNLIKLLDSKGYTVEISSVMTDHSIRFLPELVQYFSKNFPRIIVYPFPVRFSDYVLSPTKENIEILRSISSMATVGSIPPKTYFENFIKVLSGKREHRCFLPIITATVCEDGSMPLCPCGNIGTRENILSPKGKMSQSPPSIDHPIIKSVLSVEHEKCFSCFTHFDIINLFMAGFVSEEELALCGIFRKDEIRNSLVERKKTVQI